MSAADNGEAMRAAFAAYVATLPAPMQQNINEANARGESFTAKAFASGYAAGSRRASTRLSACQRLDIYDDDGGYGHYEVEKDDGEYVRYADLIAAAAPEEK